MRAETSTRDFLVGDSAVMTSALGRFAPGLNDVLMKRFGFSGQQSDRAPKPGHHQALDHASGELSERGDYPDRTAMEKSLNSLTAKHPRWKMAAALAGVAVAVAAVRRQ